jgi:hypothetical protein
MIIEVEQPTFLLDKNNPMNVSYKNEEGDNWKSIMVSTYLNGFPPLKEGDILYKYKNRGYIQNCPVLNKRYTEGDIEYEYTKLGSNILMGVYYRGEGDPVWEMDEFVKNKISNNHYTEYIDMNMDNPWVRIIIIGDESKFLFSK